MKSKLFISLFLGSALGLSAQGFKDGVEYYRADQPEEAAIILNNTLNQAGTDQATAYYYLGQIALQNGDKAAANTALNSAIKTIEMAGSKGVYHKNNVARKVSHISKAVNQMA